MPSFEFTSPEGKSYTVEGPEGATKEQAFGILQTQLAGPKGGKGGIPDSPPAQEISGQPDNSASFFDKVQGGMGAAATLATGATTGLLGRAGGTLGGIAGSIATGEFGTQEGAARAAQSAEEGAQKLTYTQSTPKSAEYLEGVGRAVDKTKLAGLGPTEAIGLAGATPRGGVRAAVAPEMDALKGIPGKLADAVTPKPTPETAALAKRAADMGIELRPDMLSNSKIMKMMGEALEQVPMSGSKAEQRQMAFNSALSKIIGGDERAKRLTPDVFDRAMTASGEKIGEISKETPIKVDAQMQQALLDRVQQAQKFETSDVAKIVNNYADELWKSAGADGVIPGEAFRKINSKIGRQIRTTSNGDLKNALRELQDDLHDALEKNISSPERLAELKDARQKYAMAKIIEPLVAKAKGGDISPAGLMGAVTSDGSKKTMMARGRGGDIGDLARIGQAFLKEPPSSGTAERGLAYGLLGGGALAEPFSATGVLAGANLYNRAGPAMTRRALNRVDPLENQPWSDSGIVNRLSQ